MSRQSRCSEVRRHQLARVGIAFVALTSMLTLSASAEPAQPYAPLIRPLKIEQVPGKPVYYTVESPGIPGKQNQRHTSNAGFVVTPQGIAVFDALGTPSLGWDPLQQIRKLTKQPLRYVVVSHYTPITFTDFKLSEIIAQRSSSRRSGRSNTKTTTRKLPTKGPIKDSISVGRRFTLGSTATLASCRPTSPIYSAQRSRLEASGLC
jgi:hypothetical protein